MWLKLIFGRIGSLSRLLQNLVVSKLRPVEIQRLVLMQKIIIQQTAKKPNCNHYTLSSEHITLTPPLSILWRPNFVTTCFKFQLFQILALNLHLIYYDNVVTPIRSDVKFLCFIHALFVNFIPDRMIVMTLSAQIGHMIEANV